jgi:hypothetical protein
MYDIVLMAVMYARQNLLHEDRRLYFGQMLPANNVVEKFTTLAEVHHDVVTLRILVEVVDMHYVWVIKLFKTSYLFKESSDVVISHTPFIVDLNSSLDVGTPAHANANANILEGY